MPDSAALQIPPLEDWRVEYARFTVFLDELPDETVYERWWRDVAESDKRVANISIDGRVEQGAVGDHVLRLDIRPTARRVDWRLQGPDPEGSPMGFVPVGSPSSATEALKPYIEKWLELSGEIAATRVALGLPVIYPVSSRAEGYQLLQVLLAGRVTLDAERSSDFTYVINRPRPSSVVDGLEINRLAKWFVWKWIPFTIHAQIGRDPHIRQTQLAEEQKAVRVDLDINTAPGHPGALAAEDQVGLYGEMGTMATEIAAQGDIE